MRFLTRWTCLFFGGCLVLAGVLLRAQAPGRPIEPATVVSSGVAPALDASAPTAAQVQSSISSFPGPSQLEPVVEILNTVLIQYQKSGDRDAEASTLCSLGNSYSSLGQQQKAIDEFQKALAIYRATGDKRNEASVLSHIGSVYRVWGFPDVAVRFYRDALRLHAQISDMAWNAVVLNNLGVTYLSLSDKKKALDYLNQARTAYKQAGDEHAAALTLINIGAVETFLAHDPQKAIDLFQQAITGLEPLNDRANEADAFEMLGVVWAGLHKQDTAEMNFKRALALYRESGYAKGESSVIRHLKDLHSREDIASVR